VKGWLAALRIARREARRAKARSLLVVALIGLPVIGLTFAAATFDTFRLNATELADRTMGTADAVVAWPFDARVIQDPTDIFSYEPAARDSYVPKRATTAQVRAALPPGSRVLLNRNDVTQFRTAAGVGGMQTHEFDYTDPLARGIFVPLRGRAPANTDEVALSPYGLRRVGAELGGTLYSADGKRSWHIVGVVEDPQELRREVAVFRPGALSAADQPGPDENSIMQDRWIVETPTPLTWAEVRKLNLVGIVALSRSVLLDPPPASAVEPRSFPAPEDPTFARGTVLGGILVLEVILLAGPAFAVGARRRRRELALVAAQGGGPAQLRRVVLADGVVLGAAAAVVGVALGVVATVAGRPLIEEYVVQARPGAFRVYPLALVGTAALAVLSGLLAALVPAWSAGRLPVVAALSGRYAPTRLRRRWVLVGLAGIGLGVAVTVYGSAKGDAKFALGGLIIGELGLVLCTPALIGAIAKLGGWVPLAPRIALRDIGRNRAAAAPAISAVLAAVAVSVLVGTLLASDRARLEETGEPGVLPLGYAVAGPAEGNTAREGLTGLEAVLRRTLPVTDVVPHGWPTCAPGASATACWTQFRPPAERECPYLSSTGALSPAQQRAARRDPRCDMSRWGRTSYSSYPLSDVVVEPDAIGRITKLPPDFVAAAERILSSGGVLVTNPHIVVDGKVTAEVYEETPDAGPPKADAGPPKPTRTVTVPGLAFPAGYETPMSVMSPATVKALGLASRVNGLIAATSRIPSQAEQDALAAAVLADGKKWLVSVEKKPTYDHDDSTIIILAIAAALITLGAAAIATGLAAAEGKADLATLAAVGASPGVRRMLSLSQTGLIAGLGSTLGVLAGVAAAAAMIFGTNRAIADRWPAEAITPFTVPWQSVAVAVLVVPAVAILGAGLLTRSRLPIERRL
jgi:putative ABC transport system permease protein